MNLREWSRTKFAFGKFANSGKTYKDVYVDDEMAGYCKWSMGRLGNRANCLRIGTLFSVHAKLWRTLERLESGKGLLRRDFGAETAG